MNECALSGNVRVDDFSKSLNKLRVCREYEESYDIVILTGIAYLFKICFEQAWKAMKEILEYHGYDSAETGSPRMIIKLAYKSGMISDSELWLMALSARNDVAHSYNENIAYGIVKKTKEYFIEMFTELENELRTKWL